MRCTTPGAKNHCFCLMKVQTVELISVRIVIAVLNIFCVVTYLEIVVTRLFGPMHIVILSPIVKLVTLN